jgi:hypothetical protein
MRRVYLPGRENIAKCYLIYTATFNLRLIVRKLTRLATPCGWVDARRAAPRRSGALWRGQDARLRRWLSIPGLMDRPRTVGHARRLAT